MTPKYTTNTNLALGVKILMFEFSEQNLILKYPIEAEGSQIHAELSYLST